MNDKFVAYYVNKDITLVGFYAPTDKSLAPSSVHGSLFKSSPWPVRERVKSFNILKQLNSLSEGGDGVQACLVVVI